MGHFAFFPCVHNQTSSNPFWRIDGDIKSTTRLPARHRFNGTGLLVETELTLNGSTYSCLVQIATPGGVLRVESRTALLTVYTSHDKASLGICRIIVLLI